MLSEGRLASPLVAAFCESGPCPIQKRFTFYTKRCVAALNVMLHRQVDARIFLYTKMDYQGGTLVSNRTHTSLVLGPDKTQAP
jgi:hypothetical protein